MHNAATPCNADRESYNRWHAKKLAVPLCPSPFPKTSPATSCSSLRPTIDHLDIRNHTLKNIHTGHDLIWLKSSICQECVSPSSSCQPWWCLGSLSPDCGKTSGAPRCHPAVLGRPAPWSKQKWMLPDLWRSVRLSGTASSDGSRSLKAKLCSQLLKHCYDNS